MRTQYQSRPQKESEIEKHLYNGIRKLGGICLKWESKHKPGLPDRLIFIAGRFYMIELKQENGKLSPGQIELHSQFKEQGFNVIVLYGMEQVKDFLRELEIEIKSEQVYRKLKSEYSLF